MSTPTAQAVAPDPPRLAAADMAARLTAPFARGADRLPLVVVGTAVAPYDFQLHTAQFGVAPRPLYILQARHDVPAGTTVTFGVRGGPALSLPLPDGLTAGTSVPLPDGTGILTGIQSGLAGGQEEWWRLTALLGTMGRLLWAVGWERDHLRRQLARTAAQRSLAHAQGAHLDRNGAGLGVVRAPGETDEAYRRRLTVARRWTLPTPAGLTAALNDAVGPIDGVADPLVLDDTNAELRRGLLPLRVAPLDLLPGQSVDVLGTLGADLRRPPGEEIFHPGFLVALSPFAADSRPLPGTPQPLLVQPVVAAAIARLNLFTSRSVVHAGYDPSAADARATGRAVLLSHDTVPSSRIAALAHWSGFDLVTHRTDGLVYAECAPGELLGMDTAGGTLPVDGTITLSVRPLVPPPGSLVRWYVLRCGAGRGELAGPTEGTSVVLRGKAAGRVVVVAELRLADLTLSATREIVVRPVTVADNTAIGADGTLDPDPPPPMPPGEGLHPAFLVRHDDPAHAEYGTDAETHRMRREVAEHLDGLIALVPAATTGKLVVRRDLSATAGQLAKEARELRLSHPGLPLGTLGALAHRAGFTYVRVAGGVVTVAQEHQDPVRVTAPGLFRDILPTGTTVPLTVTPSPAEIGAAGLLGWSTGDGAAALLTTAPAAMSVRGEHGGPAWVQASYRVGDKPGAYQFTVRLRPELTGHTLPPATRSLIVSLLDGLRPLGVEVVTRLLPGGNP
ncbi:hypothetical protein EES41_35500 [Streptomyces sp. ADI95-16]|uniref:hypothetical protein n=2 Tax=unclassified Streptomyces TaxID=2593676 RepID=UPI000F3AA0AF|nr:hypothetical protein [Streptomyces sp. ADI95-16]AYV32061.1 hypothetical protein EES41_35500 [Streptomyces sp. ADI95-16]